MIRAHLLYFLLDQAVARAMRRELGVASLFEDQSRRTISAGVLKCTTTLRPRRANLKTTQERILTASIVATTARVTESVAMEPVLAMAVA